MRTEVEVMVGAYKSINKRFTLVCVLLTIAIIVILVYGLTLSQYPMSFTEAYDILINEILGHYPKSNDYDVWIAAGYTYDQWFKHTIVTEMNLPRMLAGLAVGGTLAATGTIMQAVVKNPLADPFTTGISSGALLGVSLFIVTGYSVIPLLTGQVSIMVNAFVFALIPTAVIVGISIFKKNISPTMMILVGIGVMYLFSAISTMLRYSADPDSAQEIFTWTLGTLGSVNWENLPILMVGLVVSIIVGLVISRYLNVLSAGDNVAKCLGVNVKTFRILSLTIVAILAAITVAFTGSIGFIGLVCPHIARMLVGANNRMVMPCSVLVGATVLMASDCVAKIILTAGLPVGTITALIGSPIFIYLLIKQRGSSW